MHACQHAKFDVVNYLSVRKVDLNIQDSEGRSLLMKCLLAEQYELASKLITRGADIDFVNQQNGQTALTIAIK